VHHVAAHIPGAPGGYVDQRTNDVGTTGDRLRLERFDVPRDRHLGRYDADQILIERQLEDEAFGDAAHAAVAPPVADFEVKNAAVAGRKRLPASPGERRKGAAPTGGHGEYAPLVPCAVG